MGILGEIADALETDEETLKWALKTLLKSKKPAKVEGAHEFIAYYCEEFKKVYKTNPPIDGKSQGLAKTLVKDLGLAKCKDLVLTYLQMRRRDFVLKHHDLVTFKFNLNAITVQANRGKSADHYDAENIGLESHNKNAIDAYLKEKSCNNNSLDF
jgi:hypothetical protein